IRAYTFYAALICGQARKRQSEQFRLRHEKSRDRFWKPASSAAAHSVQLVALPRRTPTTPPHSRENIRARILSLDLLSPVRTSEHELCLLNEDPQGHTCFP